MIKGTGYYRVNYDRRNWKLLADQLKRKHDVIDVLNRAYLIDDAFAIAASNNNNNNNRTQTVDYITAFELIEYLTDEEDYIPWFTALKALNYIGRMFHHTPSYRFYQLFVLSLLKPAISRIGTDIQPGDQPTKKLLRVVLAENGCKFGYEPCTSRARRLFDSWMQHPNTTDDPQ